MIRELLNQELSKIEKPAGIANPKDFRNEIVKFALRARARNGGKQSRLDELREDARSDREADVQSGRGPAAGDQLRRQEGQRTERKHAEFVKRMTERGYTERQVRRLVEWYMRVKQAG
jgi:serine protein kinase